MKRNLLFAFKGVVATLLIFTMVNTYAQSNRYSFDDSWGAHGMNLLHQDKQTVRLNVSLEAYTSTEIELAGQEASSLKVSGILMQGDAGSPDIPVFSSYVAVPQGASVRAGIVRKRTESSSDVNIAPAPVIPMDTDQSPLKYEKDLAVYSKNAFYPEQIVRVSDPKKIRGVDVVLISVSPFQYNPVTKELLTHRDIELEISFEGGNGQFGEDRIRSRWWDPIIRDMAINEASIAPMQNHHSF